MFIISVSRTQNEPGIRHSPWITHSGTFQLAQAQAVYLAAVDRSKPMARLVISNLGTLSSGGGKEGSTGDPHSQTLKEFGDGTTGEGGGGWRLEERDRERKWGRN